MQTAIAAIFVFLLVILLHELGHFTVAKLVGIKVNEFSIGMGPKLFQKRKGETQYTLRALPIGGYVKMEGEDEDSSDPRAFNSVSPLARIAVVAAGAIMNFVLAIIVFSIVSFNLGEPTNIIGEVIPNSPAQYGGIIEGDKFISINNSPISTWEELSESIGNSSSDENLEIRIIRNNEEQTLYIQPTIEDGKVMLGIIPHYEKSIIGGIKGGFTNTITFIGIMFDFIKMIFTGGVSINDLSGPVGVINEIGNAARMGMINLLILLGFISVNLGFFNLLPIPALDGSRLVFLIIELVRGKPVNPEKENFIHFVGLVFLLGLMLVVTYKDLIRINIFG
ncbi:MAG: RIP metalloprotease RseP [Tissierellaceae bacterium]|nr:RIP metalloprotease RseP [Tissierellaceae bacterium]